MSSPAVVHVERTGPVATITIDRAPVNALAPADWTELTSAVLRTDDDPEVRVVVLTGANDAFCAGADIRVLTERRADDDPAMMLSVVAETCTALRRHRSPVISAISGPAHGGGLELALASDLRVCDGRATFAAAGVNMGLIASVASLIDAIGDTRARRMLLTGDTVDAATAQRWGLVTDLVDAPLDHALGMGAALAAKAPLAIEATKRAIDAHAVLDRVAHGELVRDFFAELIETADHAEAIAAFLEKRPPRFGRA